VIAYVLLKDNQGDGNSKERQDQPQEVDGRKQGDPNSPSTPGPKSGDPSWMWQSGGNPLERGAYHRN
jgi:hypothetical protein